MSHSNDLNALVVIGEPVVNLFDTVRIFEGRNGIRKIHTVLAKIFSGFAIVPLVPHRPIVPDTGSGRKRRVIERSVLSRIWYRFGIEWRVQRAIQPTCGRIFVAYAELLRE